MTNAHTPISAPGALPERTVLHERYIVGPVMRTPTKYAISYLGLDKQTQQKVIIRELFPAQLVGRGEDGLDVVLLDEGKQAAFDSVLAQFLEQTGAYPVVNHPAVFSGVEVFQENNTAYQVTDFVAGKPLTYYLDEHGGKLGEHDALQLFIPLLNGIEVMHQKDYVHGHIDPASIYVMQTQEDIRLVLMNLAAQGKASPTPGYTPPEIAAETTEPAKSTDVYSMAAVLYRVLTGQEPPTADERVAHPVLPVLDDEGLGLSESIRDGLRTGMAIVPEQRPHTILGFKLLALGEEEKELIPGEELSEADESLFEGLEPAEGEGTEKKSSSRNTKILLGLILGTILIVLVPAWFFIISPMLSMKQNAQNAMQDFMKQVQTMNKQQPAQPVEEPQKVNEENMTQREREVQRLLEAGDQALSEGNTDLAINNYQQAASMTPNNPKVYLALGNAYLKAERNDNAIQSYEKVIRLDPNNAEAYGNLGFIYFDSNRQVRAFDYFRKAVALKDNITISFLQDQAKKGNATAQNLLRDNGISWE